MGEERGEYSEPFLFFPAEVLRAAPFAFQFSAQFNSFPNSGFYYVELVEDGVRNWQNYTKLFPTFYGISYVNNYTYPQAVLNNDGSCQMTFVESVYCKGWNTTDQTNYENSCKLYRHNQIPPIYGEMYFNLTVKNNLPYFYNSTAIVNTGIGMNKTTSAASIALTFTKQIPFDFPFVSCDFNENFEAN